MQHPSSDTDSVAAKVPWNKGKMIGAKPPLQTRHVWSIRTKLRMDGKKRDLALFNLAIDSKLRGCDVDVRVRPCISQGFGCMPCKRRSGLSGPMGISSKLIICALPKGNFSSIS
jgi:hypothetical protein